MIRRSAAYLLVVICIQGFGVAGFCQDHSGIYVDPNRGDKKFRRSLIMNSNRVESIVSNFGTYGDPSNHPQSGTWPGGTGHGHVQQMSIMVSAEVKGQDGQIYHVTSESYGDPAAYADRSPSGVEYFWNPVPGYDNESRAYLNPNTGIIDKTSLIANSSDRTTWPPSWPGKDMSWDGHWNGYFGKDQFSADQECVYVMDDAANSEFPYYPIASDTTRRGLGLQVEARMFQWAHPLAEDEIFIHFQVTSIADKSYDYNIFFGAFADTHPGGSGSVDDDSYYTRDDNMVYAWDNDDIGMWDKYRDILPGYIAWKYLESPGIPNDGVDNDNDGLIDERRDNDAGTWIFGPIGRYGAPCWHWSGDEDGDWNKDVDDVGADGIGPLDPNYAGPDADGTEGNGKPDQGEPNFGKTDKDESDQIGLTSFYSPAYGSIFASDDERIWNYIQPGVFETPAQDANNIWIFSSGPFKLDRFQTERFSVCWLFGQDKVAILRNAVTSQRIYDNSYRFTKPPLPPKVKAVAGDKKVILYWDDSAERSKDPIYGYDFEGYKIFRGTDPQMSESNKITDGYGNIAYRKPIAQFDLNDGIKGMHPIALGSELGSRYSNGAHYYLGDDSGLQHFFVDTDVQNGVTYYYVVVSYDKGYYPGMDDRGLASMSPAESAFKITATGGVVSELSSNAVAATPNAPASDYVPGKLSGNVLTKGAGTCTGLVTASVVDPDRLPASHVYEVTFATTAGADSGIGIPFATSYTVRDTTTNQIELQNVSIPLKQVPVDTLHPVAVYNWQTYDTAWTSLIFTGIVLNFSNATPSILAVLNGSGWKPGSQATSQVQITFGDASAPFAFPVNFEIHITDTISGASYRSLTSSSTFNTYFYVVDASTGAPIPFYLKENLFTRNGRWDNNEVLYICVPKGDGTFYGVWALDPLGGAESTPPTPGDVFRFSCPVPFTPADKFYFSTNASITKREQGALDKVSVVPNPYIAAASWEQESALSGRGQRKIDFIHLPSECVIKIFTQNGTLIRTIQHSRGISDGAESWDLTTRGGLEVAFGIYVYYVESPGLKPKIGTFAIIN